MGEGDAGSAAFPLSVILCRGRSVCGFEVSGSDTSRGLRFGCVGCFFWLWVLWEKGERKMLLPVVGMLMGF